jgi:hypothetical protein
MCVRRGCVGKRLVRRLEFVQRSCNERLTVCGGCENGQEGVGTRTTVLQVQLLVSMIELACNPSYSGGEGRRISVCQTRQKRLPRSYLKKARWVQWYMPIVPAMQEAGEGGFWSQSNEALSSKIQH